MKNDADHPAQHDHPQQGTFLFCRLCAEEMKAEDEARGDGHDHHVLRLQEESRLGVMVRANFIEVGCLKHREIITRLELHPKEVLNMGACQCEVCKKGGQNTEAN